MGEGRSTAGPRRVAVVLGAGGSVGYAYSVGVLAALAAEFDWDPRTAQVLVGTSAGSVVAAYLRAGWSAPDLLSVTLGEPLGPVGRALIERAYGAPAAPAQARRAPAGLRPAGPGALRSALRRPWAARPGVLGAALLPSGRRSAETIVAPVRGLHGSRWPARSLWLPAVRLRDGARVVFGQPGAPPTDVATAVAASCAIPAYYAPVEVAGAAYVDGGTHSPTNADLLAPLAPALDLVVVVAPMGIAGGTLQRRVDLPVRLYARARLRREVAGLRRAGIAVVTIEPQPADLAAMGVDQLAESRSADVARSAGASVAAALAASASLAASLGALGG